MHRAATSHAESHNRAASRVATSELAASATADGSVGAVSARGGTIQTLDHLCTLSHTWIQGIENSINLRPESSFGKSACAKYGPSGRACPRRRVSISEDNKQRLKMVEAPESTTVKYPKGY